MHQAEGIQYIGEDYTTTPEGYTHILQPEISLLFEQSCEREAEEMRLIRGEGIVSTCEGCQ